MFHVIAGPNGAGKSTLYKTTIQPSFPSAEFVNADLLAQAHYGHPAVTQEQSETGQRLAEEQRRALMATGCDLVTESTFSHPSKLDLLKDAKAAGYELRVYHVNLRSPDLAVKRVARRVNEGGHPVPEDKIRARYVRNQGLIREAALMADRAYVFDNSEFGKPHTRVLAFKQGQAVFVGNNTPAWARELYAKELLAHAPERVNRHAASYARASELSKRHLGDGVRLAIVQRRATGRFSGPIIAETDLHTVQQVGPAKAVAHLKSRLPSVPPVGDQVVIAYVSGQAAVTLATAADSGSE